MAATTSDVVGTSPISITGTTGGQRVVPLSALEFSGSTIQLKPDWSGSFDTSETAALRKLAEPLAAGGELTAPPLAAPQPALLFTATHPGPESNGITVAVAPEAGTGPSTPVQVTVTETDQYTGLAAAADAATRIGVDTPTGNPGDPGPATGLVAVKHDSVSSSTDLPSDGQSGGIDSGGSFDVKADDNSVLFTLVPRADYAGSGGLSVAVARDASGTTCTVTASYDSTHEAGTQDPITALTPGDLPTQVAFVVTASAPPRGAATPAAASVPLTGGSAGIAAHGIAYTS